jgi:DNA-binding LytR/AlgR family response regulator
MINIAICDDEPSYQEIISHKVRQCIREQFDMECSLECFNSLSELKKYLAKNKVDIVFLDIMVNDENSMDWSIENIKSKSTQIVFMTAFPQSAYNISESNCCYYIVKSRMTDEILTKALRRALQKASKKDPNLTIVKTGSKNYVISYQDILYIETFDNDIMLHLKNKDDITIYTSLKDYSKVLPPNFLRCHKSYMVNMNHITGYEPHKFIINTGEFIPIPPKKYNATVKTYKSYLENM